MPTPMISKAKYNATVRELRELLLPFAWHAQALRDGRGDSQCEIDEHVIISKEGPSNLTWAAFRAVLEEHEEDRQ